MPTFSYSSTYILYILAPTYLHYSAYQYLLHSYPYFSMTFKNLQDVCNYTNGPASEGKRETQSLRCDPTSLLMYFTPAHSLRSSPRQHTSHKQCSHIHVCIIYHKPCSSMGMEVEVYSIASYMQTVR